MRNQKVIPYKQVVNKVLTLYKSVELRYG